MNHHSKTMFAHTRFHLVVAMSLAVGLSACSDGHDTVAPDRQPPVTVTLHNARVEPVATPFEVGGTLRAGTTATLVSRLVAEVREVLVQPGDPVRAGQVLLRLDSRELMANRARAEASAAAADQTILAASTAKDGAEAGLALAKVSYDRINTLRSRNSATASELDQATAALRAAEAQSRGAQAGVRQAESAAEAARAAVRAAAIGLSYSTITAPFGGIVTEKLVEPGNMASPGVPLLTVEDTRDFRLEVRVDEGRLPLIDRAQPVAVHIESLRHPGTDAATDTTLTGKVSEISRALAPGSHAYLVKIALPHNPALRSGMFGRARFAGPPARRLVVPAAAVIRRGQLTSVFVAGRDGHARLRLVNVGASHDGGLEIAAGLDEGEQVIVAPPPALVDGTPFRAAGRAAADTRRPEVVR